MPKLSKALTALRTACATGAGLPDGDGAPGASAVVAAGA